MVALQIISRILQTQDISIIDRNNLTVDYFTGYKDEFEYIVNHYKEYGNVPDKLTFLSKFNEFEIVEVQESESYLVDAIREEYLYYKAVPVVQKVAELLQTDSNAAAEYMIHAMQDLKPNYRIGGVDIIQNAEDRYKSYIDRRDNQQNWYFTTGFPELDDVIHGINRAEELFVIFARVNQGKSFVLEKICSHIWEIGFNVGYISPEMGELSIGYRFDALYKNFSNSALMWGNKDFDEKKYKKYINELKQHKNKFVVATPADFNNQITISKLKKFIAEHNLDVIAIDGITYMSDERGTKRDSKTDSLTNIAQDLKSMGMELGVPVLTVVPANRSGVVDKDSDDLPELESIRDSDGIAHNATIVLAVKQGPDGVITLQIKKGRGNRVGDKVSYKWNPDIGEFISENGSITSSTTTKHKKKIVEKEDVF